MKFLTSKSDNKKGIILAFNEDDVKTLQILYKNSLVFGMYLVWFRQDDRPIEKLDKQIQPIISKFPSAEGLAFINIVKGFVPINTKEIQ